MEIGKSFADGILTLALTGDFDTTETDYFTAEISEAIDAGRYRVLLDLSGLEFINSTALGALLRAQKRLAQYGGGLAATKAPSDVARTFRVLQLDRRIPLHDEAAPATDYLKQLRPDDVPPSGDEVEFGPPGDGGAAGVRPRRGRLESIHEEGLVFSFENLSGENPEEVFPVGGSLRLRFRLPLYHPTHVFQPVARIDREEQQGRETIFVEVSFTELSDTERGAIRQYVKDLRFLREDR